MVKTPCFCLYPLSLRVGGGESPSQPEPRIRGLTVPVKVRQGDGRRHSTLRRMLPLLIRCTSRELISDSAKLGIFAQYRGPAGSGPMPWEWPSMEPFGPLKPTWWARMRVPSLACTSSYLAVTLQVLDPTLPSSQTSQDSSPIT